MDTLSRTRLVDMLIEAYVDWREACTQSNEAYCAGASATGPGGRAAFEIYLAALDDEEQAAAVYAGVVSYTRELLWSEASVQESYEATWRVSSA